MTMIWAAFTSEWTKLKRKTLFLSTFLGLAAAASLFVVLLFSQATNNGGLVTLHQLARPNGLVIGVARASMLLGVVAFGIAASQLASEYSLGTLRQLLVRQPRRATLLAGKMLGVITFLVAALCFAAVIALIVAVLAAQSRGVSTHAWFTGTGLSDMFQELGDLALPVSYRFEPGAEDDGAAGHDGEGREDFGRNVELSDEAEPDGDAGPDGPRGARAQEAVDEVDHERRNGLKEEEQVCVCRGGGER